MAKQKKAIESVAVGVVGSGKKAAGTTPASTTYRQGSTGKGVENLQQMLTKAGYNVGGVDGVYGSKTAAAVQKYQKDHGLTADGIAGKNTLGSLYNQAQTTLNTVAHGIVNSGVIAAGGKPTFTETPSANQPVTTTPTTTTPTAKPTTTTPTAPTTTPQTPAETPTTPTEPKQPEAPKAPVDVTPSAEVPEFTYDDFSYDTPFTYDDFSYGDFSYADYAESAAVQQANALLSQWMAQKPGDYSPVWADEANKYLSQFQNRDPFSYDVNSDALYNQYKDQYIQQGQMAMMDTMGQAAAMTGGYGNSYAQTVGQQAYNQQLGQLNEVMPELYSMARDRYDQDGQDMLNMYGIYMDRENQEYAKHQDTLNNWYTQLEYLTGRADTERNYDYNKWLTERNQAYDEYSSDRNLAYDAWSSGRAQAYDEYSSDRALAYDQYTSDRSLAYDDYVNSVNMAYQKDRDAVEDARWQAEWDEEARRYEQERADAKAAAAAAAASRDSNSSDGEKTSYRQTNIDEDAYYAKEFGKVQSLAELDALATRMDAQGYDPDYIAAFYNTYVKKFTTGQSKDTTVGPIIGSTGGGVGGGTWYAVAK